MLQDWTENRRRRRALNKLRRDLALEQRADFDGGARRVVDRDGVTPVVARIEHWGADAEARCQRRLSDRLRQRRQTLNAGGLNGGAANFSGIRAEVETRVEGAAARFRQQRSAANVEQAAAVLTEFRAYNLLKRPAQYRDPVYAAAVLAAVVSIHVLLDGVAFGAASADGLAGGWLLAIQLAAPGVVMGLAVGLVGLRALGHVKPSLQWLGRVVVITLTPLIVFWAYYVAQLRVLAGNAIEKDETLANAGRRVFSQIVEQPLAPLDDYNALLLLVLGLAARPSTRSSSAL